MWSDNGSRLSDSNLALFEFPVHVLCLYTLITTAWGVGTWDIEVNRTYPTPSSTELISFNIKRCHLLVDKICILQQEAVQRPPVITTSTPHPHG